MRLLSCGFLLLVNSVLAFGFSITREELLPEPPPRVQLPLSNPLIEALIPYTSVTVATIHFQYGFSGEVPQVAAELAALQFIFQQQYRFKVIDITLPLTSSADAQSFLESQITSMYSTLNSLGSLAIIVYGGHGGSGGSWTALGGIKVDWASIDSNIIAPTGVDTLEIIDSCFAAGFLPPFGQFDANYPASWQGRGAFSVIAAASSSNIALANRMAFTKAVIFTLAVSEDQVPSSFTPASLFDAIPIPGVSFATITKDTGLLDALISNSYVPEYFELATSIDIPLRKIAPLSCPLLSL